MLLSAEVDAGAPWIVQPAIRLSAEYQSNPAYDIGGARYGASQTLGLSLPLSSEFGRQQIQLAANASLHDARGASAGNTSSYDVNGLWSRPGERSTVSLGATSARSSLIGADRADIGVSRGTGYDISHSARAASSWRLSERDTVAANAGLRWQRFDVSTDSDLVGGRFGTGGATYTRALGPQLQLLLSVNAGRSESDDRARRSSSAGWQVGASYQADEVWGLSVNIGRSKVRNTATGMTSSGATYDVSVSRPTATGTWALAASRGLEASAFGTLVRQDDAALSYSNALSERLSISAQLSWSAVRDTFIGFDLGRREIRQANVTASYALTRDWSLSLQVSHSESSGPGTAPSARSVATSTGGSVSLSRRFNPVSPF
jgi:hypothetical protein